MESGEDVMRRAFTGFVIAAALAVGGLLWWAFG